MSVSSTDPTQLGGPGDAAGRSGGGEMGRLIREHDWSTTPLGPIEDWTASLGMVVGLCVATTFPIAIAWGPGHIMLDDGGYQAICGSKDALGLDDNECRASAWPELGEPFAKTLHGCRSGQDFTSRGRSRSRTGQPGGQLLGGARPDLHADVAMARARRQ